MSVFVDKNITFDVSFFYEEIYDGINQIGIKILKEESDNSKFIKCTFRLADYNEMSSIREECSAINHRNEKAMLWLRFFRSKVIEMLCIDWNLVFEPGDPDFSSDDESDNRIPITANNISKMHEPLIVAIINQWAEKVGQVKKNDTDIQNK